jgi:hypothetical protein
MPTTTRGIRYPAASDPANVPLDLQELATDVDGLIPALHHKDFTATVTVPITGVTTIVTADPVTFTGHPIIVEFYSPLVAVGTIQNAFIVITLFEGATELGRLATINNPQAGALHMPMLVRRWLAPTGALTYSIRAQAGGGDATVQAGGGGIGQNLPGYIRIQRG